MSQASTNLGLPSNQRFGWFFTGVFLIFTGWAVWTSAWIWSMVCGALALIFLILTVARPQALAGMNRLWFKLGLLMGAIVSPIVLGVIFFLLITPVSLVARLFGRDVLRIKSRKTESYWVEREPPGPEPDSFKNQF